MKLISILIVNLWFADSLPQNSITTENPSIGNLTTFDTTRTTKVVKTTKTVDTRTTAETKTAILSFNITETTKDWVPKFEQL